MDGIREKLKGWKTIIFNLVMGGVVIWGMLRPEDSVPSVEEATGLLDSLMASLDQILLVVGNILLRLRTNTAVGKSA